jgi:hypothetical protein
MTNKYAVTFDIADGSFTFYTRSEWDKAVADWREELVEERLLSEEDIALLDYYELVEIVHGEEVFCDFVPQN